MTSEQLDQPNSQSNNSPSPNLAPELLLSLAAAPFLVALVAQKAVSKAVQELGLWSEELFRGDRLPILNVSSPPEEAEDAASHLPE